MERWWVAGVVALVLAACGGGRSGDERIAAGPAERVAAAEAASTGEQRARVRFAHSDVGHPPYGGEGLVDFVSGDSQMTLRFTLTELRLVTTRAGVMFLSGAGGQFAAPTEWVSIDVARLAEAEGAAFPGFVAPDPRQGLALLARAEDVREIGVGEADGDRVTMYRATVPPRADGADGAEAWSPWLWREPRAATPGAAAEVEVWLDDAGRVRLLRQPVGAGAAGNPPSQTLEFFDYGTSERVSVPAADEVTDVTDELSGE